MEMTKNQKAYVMFLCASLFPLLALAQVSTATLQGTAKDQTGALLPGVTITVIHKDTGSARNIVTDHAGRYVAPLLPIGAYEVRGELAGFQRAVRSGITLTVGMQAVVDLVLQVGAVQEEVIVSGEATPVDVSSSGVSALVDSKTMRELPLNGRNFVQLAQLQPGVTGSQRIRSGTPASDGAGMKINANGARDDANSFLLDGQDTQDVFNSTPSSGGGETLGVDSLAEFEVKTANFSAEYNKAAGAVINAVTKSGTNDFHGSVFGFLRNDNLDAANFFDNAFATGKAEFRRNQFGATAGGPLIRNKTFYFGSYEAIREAQGAALQFNVPSETARQGLLLNPATGQLEQVGVAASVQPFLDLFFLRPNGRDFGDGRAERFENRTNVKNEDFFVVKVDQNLSSTDSFFVRYSFDDGRLNQPVGPIFALERPSRNQFFSIQETRTFSPTVLLTSKFGFNRSVLAELDAPLVGIPDSLFFVPQAGEAGILTVGGLNAPGNSALRPRTFVQNVFEYGGTMSVIRGPHVLKFGATIQRYQANLSAFGANKGTFTFSTLRDFLLARPANFVGPSRAADFVRGVRQSLFGFFIQDDHKWRPRLTLNYGLRYEFVTVPTEVNGKLSNLRDLLAPEVTIGDPFFKNPSLRNFAPRVGFAWDVFGNGSTSVRSGFGIFHQQLLPNQYRAALNNPPFSGSSFLLSPPFPNAFALAADRPGNINSFDFFPEQPATYQWNLTIERQITGRLVTSVGYVGTRGLHLPRSNGAQDKNTAIPEILADGRKFFAPGLTRRNRNFAQIFNSLLDGNSFYHGLQVQVRRRSAAGLQFQASYTLAKSIDEGSGVFGTNFLGSGGPPDPFDHLSERGPSAFDARHTFVGNFLFPLPFKVNNPGIGAILNGWQLNGILNLSSAFPFSVFASGAADRDRDLSTTNIRPDLVGGRNSNPILGDPRNWFDATAFALPQPGFYGNLGRNTLRGDAFQNLDFGLQKNTFVFQEKVAVQFRAEMFNAFNHPNFQIPSTTIIFVGNNATPLADSGRVTATTNAARQIQFSMKLIW
jgi:hypothetical protein